MSSTEIESVSLDKITAILRDYRVACESREASLMGRKEVFMGKAKFGIFGDGKELAQIALARAFEKGDFLSGYYRDQTFMLAIEELTLQQYFAQLYAHTNELEEPASAGRQMNGHYGNRLLDEKGEFKNLMEMKNSIAGISPTGGQMPRTVGLGYASKLYRNLKSLRKFSKFSNNGNEVAFSTIGNAATAEGMFLETVNASGVLQIPVVMSVWDDGYGISVPNEYQITKSSISEALKGFQREKKKDGIEIFYVKGWDYEALCETYKTAAKLAREKHVPSLVHVDEMTQPQGHSTSGSHERYKPKERLQWELEYDCIKKFREWILDNEFTTEAKLNTIEKEAKIAAKDAKNAAWKSYRKSINSDLTRLVNMIDQCSLESRSANDIRQLKIDLEKTINPNKLHLVKTAKRALRIMRNEDLDGKIELRDWLVKSMKKYREQYGSHLTSESDQAPTKVEVIKPAYSEGSKLADGRELLQACFDKAFERDPRIFAIGEDVGKIGDVNQAFAGLQEKHGEIRITDTGIRETTIIGQGIGAALRGLKPITEIQYLDYIYYAAATLTDDLATLQYRTKGGQKAPMIIRTRGHRLEGVWHSGSPMSALLGSIRGIHILSPRNMTQAAGMYNTLFKSDDPALIIESLNGYRLKERIPDNVGEFTVPIGIPETLKEGEDLTLVTYGSMCRIALEASKQLESEGVSVEVIDVQTLLPFDIHKSIVNSVKKTNKLVVADEDVPGGASAYILKSILEDQKGFLYLDAMPRTVTAQAHRPAYGSDGDYFSKPSVDDVFDVCYEVMNEYNPDRFKPIY